MALLTKDYRRISHDLNHTFERIKSFRTRMEFEGSELYGKYGAELEGVSRGVEWGNRVRNDSKSDKVRVAAWNIERGNCLEGLIYTFLNDPHLKETDILLLTEADIGMGRSGNRNVPRKLAEALKMNYCFAVSYLVFSKGDLGEQGHDLENTLSLHGTAILSRYPIEEYRVVDLYMAKDAFLSSEKRLGQRRGLICKIKIGGDFYDFAAAHLELKASPKQRALQMDSLLKAMDESGEGEAHWR